MSSSHVKQEEVKSLLLYKGKLTKSTRTSPKQQLTCYGAACRYFQPDAIRCQNAGHAGDKVKWECHADLPELLRMGSFEVLCDLRDESSNSYLDKASCRMEYHLVQLQMRDGGTLHPVSEGSGRIELLVLGLITIVFCWQMYSNFRSPRGSRRANGSY
ncbi:hypothetical protein DL96DRAFT_1538488 [Flagelloscypha sp. PMI_526]|nr:hypothetical protein DL96DRAFT_1538488 [Flagelloscypha sp. PMI_526]